MARLAAYGPHPDPVIRARAAGWLRIERRRALGAGLAGVALLVPMAGLLIAILATGSNTLWLLAALTTATACAVVVAGFRFALAGVVFARLAGAGSAWREMLVAPFGGLVSILAGVALWLLYGVQPLRAMAALILSAACLSGIYACVSPWWWPRAAER